MKHVFILGAGASRDAGGPLMSDFIDIAEKLPRTAPVDKAAFGLVLRGVDELQRVLAKASLDINNIESVMVAFEMAALFQSLGDLSAEEIKSLPDAVSTLVAQTVEESVLFRIDQHGIHSLGPFRSLAQAVLALRKARQDVSILTFNYDLGMDVALLNNGMVPDYGLTETEKPEGSIPLLKLHGSLSWAVAPGDPISIHPFALGEHLRNERVLGEETRNRPLRARNAIGGRPFIVPPTWAKSERFANIGPVWRRAAKELRTAENIYVLGYSMPPTDGFFKLLYGLGAVGPTRVKRFWVFDPDPVVEQRFRELLGQSVLSRFSFQQLFLEKGVEKLLSRLRDDGVFREN